LGDAAHLQQHLGSRGFGNERPHAPPPFYGPDDVAHALKLMQPFALNAAFDVAGVITATYHNAAHILGSAFVVLELEGKKLLCSGDIGRYGRPLLYDPEPIGSGIDAIVCESTYAGQLHPPQPLEALRDALLAGQARGGAIVIPAFAVERTQDILLAIGQIQQMEPKLAKLPIYLDSPMAEKVDALFADFPDAHKPIPNDTNNSFGCNNLTMAVSTDDSKALNVLQGPRVVISSSGMAAGGRVLHHLHNNLPSADATIIFVGYQSPGTLGFVLMHGATTVKIFGDTLPVRASLTDLQGYSAHADDTDFKTWFDTCTSKPYLYAVHGEVDSAAALVSMVESKYGWQAEPGERGTTVTI
jgi:metallo-beta-lactamase family protein